MYGNPEYDLDKIMHDTTVEKSNSSFCIYFNGYFSIEVLTITKPIAFCLKPFKMSFVAL